MTPVFLNGFPKAGNHALWRAVELLGVPGAVNHEPFSAVVIESNRKHVFIKRDPRDSIISMLRMIKQPVTPGTFIARFRRFQARSLVEEMAEYEPWLSHPDVLVVKYEDLIASDAEMRRIAIFLGTPYIPGAFGSLPGLTKTWNVKRSDYRAVWTSEVRAVWDAEGGPELLARWGY